MTGTVALQPFKRDMATAKALADRRTLSSDVLELDLALSTVSPRLTKQPPHTVKIGKMLAHVTIVPDPEATEVLYAAEGLEEPEDLTITVENGCYGFSSEIPLKEIETAKPDKGFLGGLFGSRQQHNTFRVSGGSVSISGDFSGSISIDGDTVILDDVMIINGKQVDFDKAIDVIIYVPSETQIVIDEGFIGAIGIGPKLEQHLVITNGSSSNVYAHDCLTAIIESTGSGDVEIGTVDQGLTATTKSSGNITVRSAAGVTALETQGSGDIKIEGGNSDGLNAYTRGSGNISHLGVVERVAILQTWKSGNIWINYASGSQELTTNGSGDITINAGKADRLTAKTNGSGDITFMASVNGPADLATNASGDIFVSEANGEVTASTGGSGDVTIARGRSASLVASANASGDITHKGTVEGNVKLESTGSGDILVDSVHGDGSARSSGSGDIEVVEAYGDISYQPTGSGDITIGGVRHERKSRR